MRTMEKAAACEIAFIPIGINDYREKIRQVLKIIEDSGLEYQVGHLSTVVRGDRSRVLAFISNLYLAMDDICDFSMDVKLSNLCGC